VPSCTLDLLKKYRALGFGSQRAVQERTKKRSSMSKAEEVDEEHLELVEMRLDIDVDKLRAYLVANSDFPDGAVEIKQFNKGQSNPTYLLTASDGHRYVVRKQPPGHLLAGAHNVGREYQVLDALKDTEVPVPRTLLFCDDPAVIGTVSAALVAARLPACLAVNLLLACP
jgi:hypothetical protein